MAPDFLSSGTQADGTQTMTLLFVYGTLTTTADHPMGALLRRHASSVGEGTIRARLYLIDDPDDPGQNAYPGALPSPDPDDRVHGELHHIHNPDAVFGPLDDFEGCSPDWPEPHEYVRRTIEVILHDGTRHDAECYLYTWDVSTARPIPEGRFSDVAPDVR